MKYIKIFRELWKIPRYKALIELLLFFIFFLSIFVYSKIVSNNKNEIYKSQIEQYRDLTSYNFQIEINDELIDGFKKYDIITFNYDGVLYNYEEEKLNPNDFKYQNMVKYLSNKYIYDLIKDKELYSKTEYKDSSVSKLYKIDDISIELYEKEQKIYKIKIIDEYEFAITYK